MSFWISFAGGLASLIAFYAAARISGAVCDFLDEAHSRKVNRDAGRSCVRESARTYGHVDQLGRRVLDSRAERVQSMENAAMQEKLTYALYRAKAVLGELKDAYYPADPADLASQVKRHEEDIAALDELSWIQERIQIELKRIHKRAQSEDDFRKCNEAFAMVGEGTSMDGYHRVAEYYRRLQILLDL